AAWRKWPEHDDDHDHVFEKRWMAALALYLEGSSLVKSGQVERGQRLRELAHWLPLADDEARRKFLGELEERHEQDAARREAELVSQLGEPGSANTWLARLALARSWTAKKNYAAAADLRERLYLEGMCWSASLGRYL